MKKLTKIFTGVCALLIVCVGAIGLVGCKDKNKDLHLTPYETVNFKMELASAELIEVDNKIEFKILITNKTSNDIQFDIRDFTIYRLDTKHTSTFESNHSINGVYQNKFTIEANGSDWHKFSIGADNITHYEDDGYMKTEQKFDVKWNGHILARCQANVIKK